MSTENMASSLAARFDHEKYISITTFRRDGRPVATPIWFAVDGNDLVFKTGEETGKAKRLRHTPRILLAVSDARGRIRGEAVEAIARRVPDSDGPRVNALLTKKYGLVARIFYIAQPLIFRVRRLPPTRPVYFRISAAP